MDTNIPCRLEFSISRSRGWLFGLAIAVAAMHLAAVSPACGRDPIRPNPHNLRLGLDKTEAPNDRFRPTGASEIDDIESPLQEICPCLFIRAVTANVKNSLPRNFQTGDIIIREPGDVDDLAGIPGFDPRATTRMKDDFCDCYQRHRAGCNLVWSLATASTPTTFWRSRADDPQRDAAGGDAGGNRHNHGHIGWNPGQPRGGKTENERTSYRPTSVGLAHEMAHAYHSAGLGGTSNPHETNRTQAGRLEEEFSAVRAENQIRRELHEEAQRDLEKNPNSRLARERAARTEPRIEYTLGRESHRVPNHTGTNIDVADLFECDKPKRLAVPAPAPGPEPGKDIKKTLIPEDREGAFFIPGRSFSMTSNVSTDAQKFCSYGKATPRSVVLEPADADGNPLVVKSDPRLAFALAVLLAATTPMPIGNPDGAPQQGKPKEGGGSQTPGASAPSTPDAGTPAAKSPATPTATASVAPPQTPG